LFASIVDLSTRLREARVTLYSINPMISSDATYYQAFLKGVTKPSSVQIANLALQVIAVQSGGLALTSSNDTAAMLQQCVADTAAYYEVSFDPVPAATPDEYHKLNVQLAKTGLAARTRDGYYAQP
jgi:VWFA-related protein